jgi:hypothetical protein
MLAGAGDGQHQNEQTGDHVQGKRQELGLIIRETCHDEAAEGKHKDDEQGRGPVEYNEQGMVTGRFGHIFPFLIDLGPTARLVAGKTGLQDGFDAGQQFGREGFDMETGFTLEQVQEFGSKDFLDLRLDIHRHEVKANIRFLDHQTGEEDLAAFAAIDDKRAE